MQPDLPAGTRRGLPIPKHNQETEVTKETPPPAPHPPTVTEAAALSAVRGPSVACTLPRPARGLRARQTPGRAPAGSSPRPGRGGLHRFLRAASALRSRSLDGQGALRAALHRPAVAPTKVRRRRGAAPAAPGPGPPRELLSRSGKLCRKNNFSGAISNRRAVEGPRAVGTPGKPGRRQGAQQRSRVKPPHRSGPGALCRKRPHRSRGSCGWGPEAVASARVGSASSPPREPVLRGLLARPWIGMSLL